MSDFSFPKGGASHTAAFRHLYAFISMKTSGRRKWISPAAGVVFWSLLALLLHRQLNPAIDRGKLDQFQSRYQESVRDLHAYLDDQIQEMRQLSTEEEQFTTALVRSAENNFHLLVYLRDSLVLWTDNRVAAPVVADGEFFQAEVLFLENGWYHAASKWDNDRLYVALFTIKSQFRHENSDLVNSFSEELTSGLQAELTLEARGHPIYATTGERYFSVIPSAERENKTFLELVVFCSFLLALMTLLRLLTTVLEKSLSRHPLLRGAFPMGLLLLRYASLRWKWTPFLSHFELFDQALFSSSAFAPSLGDLIVNVAIGYFLVHFILNITPSQTVSNQKRKGWIAFVGVLWLVGCCIAFNIDTVIHSLVYASKLSFDLRQVLDFSVYSLISIALIGLLFYIYFRWSQSLVALFEKVKCGGKAAVVCWAATAIAYLLIVHFYFGRSPLTALWPFCLNGFLLWFHVKEKAYRFAHVTGILAFFALYVAYILREYTTDNENNLRKEQAEAIAVDKDLPAELQYGEIERRLQKDAFLLQYFNENFDQATFSETLESFYFNQLKNDYDLTFFLFDTDQRMIVDFGNYRLTNDERFEEIIRHSGTPSSANEHLYFISDYTDKLTYIARFPIQDEISVCGYLITEFRSKKFPEEIGLPSVLLGEKTPDFERLKAYSVAKYVDGKLVRQKGDYTYPTVDAVWPEESRFVTRGGYSHYCYREEEGVTTIFSREQPAKWSLITSFSYLLVTFGLLLLLLLGTQQLRARVSLKKMSLTTKIQIVLVGLILVTLVVFASGSGFFVNHQYAKYNSGLIREKLGSVRTELESKLKREYRIEKDMRDYLHLLLKKFSGVFLTDINLYDTKGNLLASSQPKIYSKGLISKKMNATAYQHTHLSKKSEFIHEERIGQLSYLSAYTPFFNQRGHFLAYLNVQHISRQGEFEDQIATLLLAIVNILVLMLTISTVLAVTVSNWLTRPLKYIQESLKNVQIGAKHRPIAYKGTDEIGSLVEDYNKKVAELQQNAVTMAKSEKEQAWREMAKQVAHEIKNPLTPMKLSIQHLKRSVKTADNASAEKLDRVSVSLIEQIDTLTRIANEFSHFAQMPKAHDAPLNLSEILRNAVAVFSDDERYTIALEILPKEASQIWADKNLLLRVFNNLIANAIQASPPHRSAKVHLRLTAEGGRYIVSVEDNGIGIDEDTQKSLFVPYFTTKSKGMGLGLAISKQIVESMKGRIWFETTIGQGTVFYVSFPLLNRLREDETSAS